MENVSDSFEDAECDIKEECLLEEESLDTENEESTGLEAENVKQHSTDDNEDSLLMNEVALNQENEEMVEECEPFAVVYVSSDETGSKEEQTKNSLELIHSEIIGSRTGERVRLPTTRYLENAKVSDFIHLARSRIPARVVPKSQGNKRQARASEQQLDIMVDYLYKHPYLASGRAGSTAGGRYAQGSWEDLAKKLNSLFPAGKSKDVDSWKISWRDNKTKVSGKYASVMADKRSTNEADKTITLTERDWKTMKLIRRNVARSHKNIIASANEADLELDRREQSKAMDVTESLPESTTQSDVIVEEIHNNLDDATFEILESSALLKTEDVRVTEPLRKRKHEETPTTSKVTCKGLMHERLNDHLGDVSEKFADLAERNVIAIEELAKAQNKLADAVLIMAETQKVQADLLKRIVESDEKHKHFVSKLRSILN